MPGGRLRRRDRPAARPDQGRPGRPGRAAGRLRRAAGPQRRHGPRRWTDRGLEHLRERLRGRVSVLVGHSGVGKSTLVNALMPGAARAIGEVNIVTGRGRHTSTSAVVLPLPHDKGWIIDTPGIRSFGLAHVDPGRIFQAFADLAAGTEQCPRSCSHDEPECALDAWVAAGHADPRAAGLAAPIAAHARGPCG